MDKREANGIHFITAVGPCDRLPKTILMLNLLGYKQNSHMMEFQYLILVILVKKGMSSYLWESWLFKEITPQHQKEKKQHSFWEFKHRFPSTGASATIILLGVAVVYVEQTTKKESGNQNGGTKEPYKAIWGVGFPLHKPYPYSLYRWGFLHFRYVKRLVKQTW